MGWRFFVATALAADVASAVVVVSSSRGPAIPVGKCEANRTHFASMMAAVHGEYLGCTFRNQGANGPAVPFARTVNEPKGQALQIDVLGIGRRVEITFPLPAAAADRKTIQPFLDCLSNQKVASSPTTLEFSKALEGAENCVFDLECDPATSLKKGAAVELTLPIDGKDRKITLEAIVKRLDDDDFNTRQDTQDSLKKPLKAALAGPDGEAVRRYLLHQMNRHESPEARMRVQKALEEAGVALPKPVPLQGPPAPANAPAGGPAGGGGAPPPPRIPRPPRAAGAHG